MNKKTTRLFIIILYIPIFLALSLYVVKGLLWGNSSEYFEAKATMKSNVNLKGFTSGGTITLNSEEVNTLIELYMPKVEKKGNLLIENITCDIKDSKIKFYIPVNYHNIKVLLSTEGTLQYVAKVLYYYPDYFKIGKLTVPKSISYKLLNKYEIFNNEKKALEIKTNNLPFEIESLKINKDKIVIKLGKFSAKSINLLPLEDKDITSLYPIKEVPSLEEPSENLPEKAEEKEGSENKNSKLLKETKEQLQTAHGATNSKGVKEIIEIILNTVDKMIADENYSYKEDVKAVKEKYVKLTEGERSEFRSVILNNMKIKTLLNLKDMFLF